MEYFYFEQEPSLCRASFAITHLGQLQSSENSLWLDANSFYQQPTYQEAALGELIAKKGITRRSIVLIHVGENYASNKSRNRLLLSIFWPVVM